MQTLALQWICWQNTPKKMNFTTRFRKSCISHIRQVISFLIWTCFNVWFYSKFLAEVPAQMLLHVCPGWLKAVWIRVQSPRSVRAAAALRPREDRANVTFLKCFDANLRDRKVPPWRSEGIGLDTCPPKYRLLWTGREHFQFALKRLMYFSCSTPVKVRPFILVLE